MRYKNHNVRRYCSSVYRLLPCSRATAKRICVQMKETVEDFLAEQPDAGYEDIVARFGTPEQVAISSLEEQPGESVLNKLNLRKRIIKIVTAAAVLISVCMMSVLGYVAYECYNGSHGRAKIEIIEVVFTTETDSKMIGAGTE